jgi:hypothetical protein
LSIAHQLLLVVLQCYNNIFIAIENHWLCYNLDLT